MAEKLARLVASKPVPPPTAQDKSPEELQEIAAETEQQNKLHLVELLADRNGIGVKGEQVRMRYGAALKYRNSGVVRIIGEADNG